MPERGGPAERMERGHNVLGKRGKQGEGRAVALDPTWAVRTEETSHIRVGGPSPTQAGTHIPKETG
jgi:hypothetical protein